MVKKKIKKKRFESITFKLSKQQKRALMLFCQHHGITPITLIKRSIARYTKYVPKQEIKPYVHPKQLDLLDEIENYPE
jgi:hypothetical protein